MVMNMNLLVACFFTTVTVCNGEAEKLFDEEGYITGQVSIEYDHNGNSGQRVTWTSEIQQYNGHWYDAERVLTIMQTDKYTINVPNCLIHCLSDTNAVGFNIYLPGECFCVKQGIVNGYGDRNQLKTQQGYRHYYYGQNDNRIYKRWNLNLKMSQNLLID